MHNLTEDVGLKTHFSERARKLLLGLDILHVHLTMVCAVNAMCGCVTLGNTHLWIVYCIQLI